MVKKLFLASIFVALIVSVLSLTAVTTAYFILTPRLPDINTQEMSKLQVPLRVYSADNKLIAEFGEVKRQPLSYPEIPTPMVNAILAAEDDRFFEHPGVDYQGIARAAWHLITTGQKGQGGSTITMQVARNFFLSREKTFLRKFTEIFLAIKIEQAISKEDILTLYLNKIYLGHRSYGVGAAAEVYYGKPIEELNLPQYAMIAGLPKAPSAYNPITNRERATIRRNYVLSRMHTLGYITTEDYEWAKNYQDDAKLSRQNIELEAPYVAEMVRANMVKRFGNEAYTEGFEVYTTVKSDLQAAADKALRKALLNYEYRHGYRGPVKSHKLAKDITLDEIKALLKDYPTVAYLQPALVGDVTDKQAIVFNQSGQQLTLPWEALEWARPYINENRRGAQPKQATDILSVGDVVYIEPDDELGYRLSQIPTVSGALVSVNPADGAIIALSGGFDFYQSKFNRVTQANRQPGSNFKPFIYSAALNKDYTTATLINDAPVVFADSKLEDAWRPENYSGKFFGPTRLRQALIKSRNLVSIRILRDIGVRYALNFVDQFGFNSATLPHDLSLSLGSGVVTPLDLVVGYAAFANGGYKVDAHVIERIQDNEGIVLYQAKPPVVCRDIYTLSVCNDELGNNYPQAKKILSDETTFLITTIMQDVIKQGTGRRALSLKRGDIAGKTGTTNEQHDAWFSGFNPFVATTVWVGFDTPLPLGSRETGGRAALPMWIDYMAQALPQTPELPLTPPEGIVTVRIDAETGQLASPSSEQTLFEYFREGNQPQQTTTESSTPDPHGNSEPVTQELF